MVHGRGMIEKKTIGLNSMKSKGEKRSMQVQVNTDNNVPGHEAMAAEVSAIVEKALSPTSNRITRVEVHLTDENSHKVGQKDERCALEARMERRRPVAVTHQAATLDQAVNGAADKLTRIIMTSLDQRREKRRQRTDPPLPRA